MGKLIPAIAKSRDGVKFPVPEVVYLNEDNIKCFTADGAPTATGKQTTKVIETLPGGHKTAYQVYEKAAEIEAQRNPLTTDLVNKQMIATGLAGLGTTQGAGLLLSKFFSELTTIGAGATEAFTLTAATVGLTKCIINNDASGDAAKIFPAVGEFIGTGAVNAVYSLPAGKRLHLVCLVAGTWTIANDYGAR